MTNNQFFHLCCINVIQPLSRQQQPRQQIKHYGGTTMGQSSSKQLLSLGIPNTLSCPVNYGCLHFQCGTVFSTNLLPPCPDNCWNTLPGVACIMKLQLCKITFCTLLCTYNTILPGKHYSIIYIFISIMSHLSSNFLP